MPRIVLSLFALFIVFATPAVSADLQKGMDAAMRGDFATALREWKPLAEQGDAKAQFNLGVMYDNGRGVVQNFALAHMWWNIAASKGHKDAGLNLDVLEKKMTSEDVHKAQRLARICLAKDYKYCN